MYFGHHIVLRAIILYFVHFVSKLLRKKIDNKEKIDWTLFQEKTGVTLADVTILLNKAHDLDHLSTPRNVGRRLLNHISTNQNLICSAVEQILVEQKYEIKLKK